MWIYVFAGTWQTHNKNVSLLYSLSSKLLYGWRANGEYYGPNLVGLQKSIKSSVQGRKGEKW